jgi:DNA-binding transcriptional LysR family regulator
MMKADGYTRLVGVSLPAVRAFVAVAKAGSFRAAAADLAVSQPTVSAAVARFETHSGAPLLHRGRDGVQLTELGQRVLLAAEQVVSAADDLESALANGPDRDLTIGFMGEAAASSTAQIVASAKHRTGRQVHLRRFDFEDPSCGLLSGKSDLAIVWPPISSAALGSFVVTEDRRAIVLPVSDALVRKETIAPADLGGRIWVVPRSSDLAWTAYRHPNTIGVTDVAGIIASGAVEETLELVAAGAGIAIMSDSTGEHYARIGVIVVPLAGNLRCTAALAWRKADHRPVIGEIVADITGLPGTSHSAAALPHGA